MTRSLGIMLALCASALMAACAPFHYVYYEPTTSGARFKPGMSCAGPHDEAIFPPELHGVQIGVLVDARSRMAPALRFTILEQTANAFMPSDDLKREWADTLTRRFDIYSPTGTLHVTFRDGESADFVVPYLADAKHRSFVNGHFDGPPFPEAAWHLPAKAAEGLVVTLPDVLVDGKPIRVSPVEFTLKKITMIEGINC